jgi:hypothetical protein
VRKRPTYDELVDRLHQVERELDMLVEIIDQVDYEDADWKILENRIAELENERYELHEALA